LAYTAQEVAQTQHVPGREMAKTIILKTDLQFAIVVLPAVMKINMKTLRDELPFAHVELATEKELAELFPDSELGAMAPFGTFMVCRLCRQVIGRGCRNRLQRRYSH
jgi:Ala-tRNA(Pro) deacylase